MQWECDYLSRPFPFWGRICHFLMDQREKRTKRQKESRKRCDQTCRDIRALPSSSHMLTYSLINITNHTGWMESSGILHSENCSVSLRTSMPCKWGLTEIFDYLYQCSKLTFHYHFQFTTQDHLTLVLIKYILTGKISFSSHWWLFICWFDWKFIMKNIWK